jgi:hypothetical protein
MKLASVIPSVDATSPPTFIWAPGANNIPLGLTRKTLPLADKVPKMADGSAPRTRFSATELLLGCWKVTASAGPIPKLCQLITAF